MVNFIDIYSFIHVSGCVFMGSSAMLCPGPIMLLRRPCVRAKNNVQLVLVLLYNKCSKPCLIIFCQYKTNKGR